ncbi:hypothetical protein [Streptomyces tailanensis]|uniref:hypothetical protein n=1 Tax=Streptomyces tailanensis TaxID=2569858 RepID=UPI00122E3983|nr:hypothetical protein [Streptomyces tailanensis]
MCWRTKAGKTWLYVKLSKKAKSGLVKGTHGWVYTQPPYGQPQAPYGHPQQPQPPRGPRPPQPGGALRG